MVNTKDLVGKINISEFDYTLADERIAKYPLAERDQSKLLVYRDGKISETLFTQLPNIVSNKELLVFNNTRVIPARMKFRKPTGATIEIFCLEPVTPSDYQLALQSNRCTWKCIVGNLRRWKDKDIEKEIVTSTGVVVVKALKVADHSTSQWIEFSWDSPHTFSEIIEMAGVTPIPPYLNRETEDIDRERYQTVYSRIKGSVAAPTAGLHFTEQVIGQLKQQHTGTAEVTLHVGAGTFKPVQAESIADHEMHTEFFSVTLHALKELIQNHGKIVSVGTTTLRTLESLYWLGVKISKQPNCELHINQWDAFELESMLSYKEALEVLVNYMMQKDTSEFYATTQILIAPGYSIRSIKALITNFHQPKSTLLLLVSAITGDSWKTIYQYAIENNFRFLSYGDSSILFLPTL